MVLILNLLVKWKLQKVPLVTPGMEPPEARQEVLPLGVGTPPELTASPHSVLGEGEDETEHLNWGLAGARNPRGHLRTRHVRGEGASSRHGAKAHPADSSTRDTAARPQPSRPQPWSRAGSLSAGWSRGWLLDKRPQAVGRAGGAWEAPVTCSTRQLAPVERAA